MTPEEKKEFMKYFTRGIFTYSISHTLERDLNDSDRKFLLETKNLSDESFAYKVKCKYDIELENPNVLGHIKHTDRIDTIRFAKSVGSTRSMMKTQKIRKIESIENEEKIRHNSIKYYKDKKFLISVIISVIAIIIAILK